MVNLFSNHRVKHIFLDPLNFQLQPTGFDKNKNHILGSMPAILCNWDIIKNFGIMVRTLWSIILAIHCLSLLNLIAKLCQTYVRGFQNSFIFLRKWRNEFYLPCFLYSSKFIFDAIRAYTRVCLRTPTRTLVQLIFFCCWLMHE